LKSGERQNPKYLPTTKKQGNVDLNGWNENNISGSDKKYKDYRLYHDVSWIRIISEYKQIIPNRHDPCN
jgi:hypothetical protein